MALCHSAFARVATPYTACSAASMCCFATAHSCGLRRILAVLNETSVDALPQRIRAGCDEIRFFSNFTSPVFATAHSCGLRPKRMKFTRLTQAFATAHSCGLRQERKKLEAYKAIFATAHSCGLRPNLRPARTRGAVFATAHSCGLRLQSLQMQAVHSSLPQRIRAGCDDIARECT